MKAEMIIRIVATWCIMLFVALGISSCRTMIEVPVETVMHDSIYIKQLERDSVWVQDSVIIYTSGDTVYNTRVQWKFRDRLVRDTVYKEKCDTTTVVREVEKKLTKVQQLKMDVGAGVMYAVPILIAVGLFLLYRKLKK